MIETPQLARGDPADGVVPMTAFGLLIVGLNGLALSALFVLVTNERLVQMVGAFATSLVFLVLGAARLRTRRRSPMAAESSGVARAAAASVVAGLAIVASGVIGTYWIGPTDAEFIRQESTRDAAAQWCKEEWIGGHVVGDVCRRQSEDLFRLPPAPIDWTRDEEGG